MNSFDGVYIDDIISYPSDTYNGGLKTRLYYSPEFLLEKIELPKKPETYEDEVQLKASDLKFRIGGWKYIDVLIDEGDLKVLLNGPIGRKRTKIELNVFALGFVPKVLGFIEKHKNTCFVFIITDANNQNWLIGTSKNRAFIESSEASTQKKYEDNVGASFKIVCNAPIYHFGNSQDWIETGIFTREFTDEYTKEFT